MAKSTASNDPTRITITNVPSKLNQELNNIADNLGTPLSAFLKPALKTIADSYPPDMKVAKDKD